MADSSSRICKKGIYRSTISVPIATVRILEGRGGAAC